MPTPKTFVPISLDKPLTGQSALCGKLIIIISHWNFIEDQLFKLMLDFFLPGIDHPIGLQYMHFSVQSFHARATQIKAAGDAILGSDDRERLAALIKQARARAKERNKLAHSVWGLADEYPDALVAQPRADAYGPTRGVEQFIIYSEHDFDEIIQRQQALQTEINAFLMDRHEARGIPVKRSSPSEP